MSPEKARVFMVDDHALIRAGIKAELAGSVEFIGEADEVAAAIEMIIDRSPDVVLLDVHMPDGGGLAVLEGVVERDASVKFLALSVSDAAEDVIAIIRAGARGYVTKSIEGPELIEAIERTAAGDAVFSRRLAGFVLDAFTKGADQLHTTPSMLDPELDQLTPREIEVLRLIARGYSYREIATQLDISIKTVESHVSAVLRKLQLSNRHQLTNWATERRLL